MPDERWVIERSEREGMEVPHYFIDKPAYTDMNVWTQHIRHASYFLSKEAAETFIAERSLEAHAELAFFRSEHT